ncbi:MAG: type II toxin-antitoxin system VapC family toxin [Candidatus Njordarchaeales archaeon]
MRIIDADMLSYALYDDHIAHPYAWQIVEKAIRGVIEVYVTPITILETYNVLYWYYKVQPRKDLLKKLKLVVTHLKITQVSLRGLDIAMVENIPLGDGFLIATALEKKIPVIVTNDKDIIKKAPKYGLIIENPIPPEIQKEMSKE